LKPETGWIVTDFIPATEPAKVTIPETGAYTASPTSAAKSTPQCPPYCPLGEYPATIGPSTGAVRQTVAMAKAINISPPSSTYRLALLEARCLIATF
jgi:hypothetical protein